MSQNKSCCLACTIAAVSALTTLVVLLAEIGWQHWRETAYLRTRAERFQEGTFDKPMRFKPGTFRVLPEERK